MSIHTDMLAYLSTQSGITDLIGAKLHPHRAIQSGSTGQSGASTPYVTYQVIDDVHDTMLESASGFADMRIQLTAWSTSYGTAHSIAEAIRQELHGMGNVTVGSTSFVFSVRHGATIDIPSDPEDFSDQGHYGVASDYLILYRSAIPTF